MKKPVILLASVALNLVLVAAVVAVRGRRSALPPAQVVAVTQPAPERSDNDAQVFLAHQPIPVAPPAKFHWGFIESSDYRQYIANLRALGCPERLVRDIIIADVGKLYANKRHEATLPWDDWQPWYSRDRHQARSRERSERMHSLQAEQRTLIKELLGVDWNEHWNDLPDDEAALVLGFLPEPKPVQILAMLEEFFESNQNVHDKVHGILLEEDRAQLARLRQRLMDKLQAMMSPAEFEELDLRAQGMGKFLEGGFHLEGVSLSGAEFRQLCALSRLTGDVIRDELLRDRKELSDEEEEQRQRAFEVEVEKLLGPARFADFQRAQQPEFREALDFTEENHLPISAAAKVSDAMRHANEQSIAIKQNQALSPEEQAAALTLLKSVTVNSLSSALGSKYATYAEKNRTDLDDLFELPSDSPEGSP